MLLYNTIKFKKGDVYDSIDIDDLVKWVIEEEKDLCNFDIDELYNELSNEDEDEE